MKERKGSQVQSSPLGGNRLSTIVDAGGIWHSRSIMSNRLLSTFYFCGMPIDQRITTSHCITLQTSPAQVCVCIHMFEHILAGYYLKEFLQVLVTAWKICSFTALAFESRTGLLCRTRFWQVADKCLITLSRKCQFLWKVILTMIMQ